MIRVAVYLLVGVGIYLAALAGAALLIAAGMSLDEATLLAATGAAGIAGGLFVWDLLRGWDRGGTL